MKCFLVLIVVVSCLDRASTRYVPVFVNDSNRLQRQDLIGGWIQSSEWFPIEVNIPDTFSTIGQGISSVGQGISSGFMNLSNGFGNWIQTIPIINRITSQFRPPNRPFKYFLLVPVAGGGDGAPKFNPFDNSASNFVPVYP